MNLFKKTAWMIGTLALLVALTECKAPTQNSETKDQASTSFSLLKSGNRYGAKTGDYYLDVIQPIIAKRCVVCHACTNGPCQLNMTSYKALARGISKDDPYGLKLNGASDTRVANNLSTDEWRKKGFISILPGADPALSADQSILYKNLLRGKSNQIGNTSFNQNEIRRMVSAHEKAEYECPATAKEYAAFEAKYPQGGMPWALPGLAGKESEILLDWVKAGAVGPSAQAQSRMAAPEQSLLTKEDPATILKSWEDFFNPEDLRGQLVARYIFEHAYLANIYFSEQPGEFYRIVRSATPYPQPIAQIVTDTVSDDPRISGRVYYRLQKVDRIVEVKTHVPWSLNLGSIKHFKDLFYQKEWQLAALPGYASQNPFEVFERIPAVARAKFLLENGQMFWQSVMRGPICLSQIATYGADSYYFIIFMNPESDPTVMVPKLGLDSYKYFFDRGFNFKAVLQGDNRFGEGRYREAFEQTLRQLKPAGLGIDDIWNGDGHDPNALLTVHRYQFTVEANNATQLPVTGFPRSVQFLSYADNERMYYNMVGQYKYWGDIKHKINAWDWTVYLRTSAEDLYVSLFADPTYRQQLRRKYTGLIGRKYFWLSHDYAAGRPARTPTNYTEDLLLRDLLKKFGPQVTGAVDTLNHWPDDSLPRQIASTIHETSEWEAGLRTLTGMPAPYAIYFPNTAYIRFNKSELYSINANRGYTPNKMFLLEKLSRDRNRDYLIAARGMLGIAPELFFDVEADQATAFLTALSQVRDLDSWIAFATKYKVPRHSEKFWSFVDWLHSWQEKNRPNEAGILELRFYDKGDMPF